MQKEGTGGKRRDKGVKGGWREVGGLEEKGEVGGGGDSVNIGKNMRQ